MRVTTYLLTPWYHIFFPINTWVQASQLYHALLKRPFVLWLLSLQLEHWAEGTLQATSRHLLLLKAEIGNPEEQRLKIQRGLKHEQQSSLLSNTTEYKWKSSSWNYDAKPSNSPSKVTNWNPTSPAHEGSSKQWKETYSWLCKMKQGKLLTRLVLHWGQDSGYILPDEGMSLHNQTNL